MPPPNRPLLHLLDDRRQRIIESRIDRSAGTDACHPWTGNLDAKGHGVITIKPYSGPLKVSRLVLTLALGRDIAPGLLACHTCDNPACCDAHLYEGTHQQNQQDKKDRGRSVLSPNAAANAAKTTFACGCRITPENTLTQSAGRNKGKKRRCRTHTYIRTRAASHRSVA